ncbi:MAG: carboxymuconolactone decarboxylase family protein [Thermodesulfobacteriota bacterium]
MSLFKMVSEQEATGKVKGVYDDIKATKGIDFVPNFWKALSVNPDHLEAVWQKLKTVMKPGKLDYMTKEMIALAVSITNNCEYCIHSHSAALKRLGLDNQAIGEIVAVVDVFCGTNRIANAYQVEPDVSPAPE